MTSPWRRWLGRGIKLVLAVIVLFFVGWQFKRDLEGLDLADLRVEPGWLLVSAALYLVSVFPQAWFWRHVHGKFGYPISFYAAIRAHYIGQLGKYAPGKALAIAIRSDLVHPYGVPYGVSIIVTFYEVLTGMASGAIVAALVYMLEPPGELQLGFHPLALGAVLIGMCGIPLLPGVFNFIIARLTARIQAIELYRLPPVGVGTLASGLVTTGLGWWVQGLSVWATLQGVVPDAPDLSLSMWAQCTAGIAFSTVVGFVIIVIPGGLGIREGALKILLSPAGAPMYIAMAVLVLRLDWILAEAVFALGAYWIKPRIDAIGTTPTPPDGQPQVSETK